MQQTAGQAIPVRWVTPHNFTQHVPDGVDFRVMLTFFEFYETLLGFVLYKLYGELGVRYPLPTVAVDGGGAADPALHPTLGGKATSVLAANLTSLQLALNRASKGNSAADAVKDALQGETGAEGGVGDGSEEKAVSKASKKKQRQLVQSIDEALKGVKEDDDSEGGSDADEDMDDDEEESAPIAEPLREALEAIDDSAAAGGDASDEIITDPEARKRHQLFNGLTFFLSREVPRGYLELIILSYGGKVGWEGKDSPVPATDASITHHVVDRPKLLPGYAKLPKSREYVQPQWILDCANFGFVLPVSRYAVGAALPPHLSPWVDDDQEGYVPKYREEIERLRNGEVLDVTEADHANDAEVAGVSNDDEQESSSDDEEESPANRVLRKEAEADGDESKDGSESSEEEEEEDDEKAELNAIKKKQTEVRQDAFYFYQPCHFRYVDSPC